MKQKNHNAQGFTLIEILVALFIFSILAIVMTEGLKRMMNFHQATVERASLLRELQFAFIMFSRDLEQAIDRQVRNSFGKLEPAFVGTPQQMSFTHMGNVSANVSGVESQLQRVSYQHQGSNFARMTSLALDSAKKTEMTSRLLSTHMDEMRFEYYSRKLKRFFTEWPLKEEKNQPLPSAVRVYVTIPTLGKMSQLYVIPSGS